MAGAYTDEADGRQAAPPTCVHCELPLGRRSVSAIVDGEQGRFCCYGCVLAWQVTRARGAHAAASFILVRLGLAIFFAMNVMVVSLPTYAPYVYGGAGSEGPLFHALHVLALVFTAPVIGLLGWPIVAGAARGLRDGAANTDAMIVLGTVAAYGLSAANTIAGHGAVYFDTAAMLLVLVTLGRYLEASAKAEAGAAVRATLAPAPAAATRVDHGAVTAVPPDTLVPGDIVRVAPGDAFPTDGVVVDGTGGVDEAALTGESRTIVKRPGSAVAGGTCSIDGLFQVRVTAPVTESAAARVAALLSAAQRERAPVERVADRVAAVLAPAVVGIAAAAATMWMVRVDVATGLLVGLAVLVVACPCALGIATPVAVWTGLTAAARRGVIIRSAPALERAAAVTRVLFDKTGTLTQRTAYLVGAAPACASALSEDALLACAAALEAGLTHPLARAIAVASEARSLRPLPASGVHVVSGRGVYGVVDGEPRAVGSVRFAAAELGAEQVPRQLAAESEGSSVVAVWRPGQLLGTLQFAETARPEAAAAIDELRRHGVRVQMLSGDTRAAAIVPALLSSEDVALGLLPEDKVAYVRRTRGSQAKSDSGAIAMVGDGVNDAPALAAADVGIAIGDATDLTRMTADVAIVNNDLRSVPWLVTYARQVRRVVRQNLIWAFAYNAVAVAAAAAGTLSPLVASLAMLASSLAVVANARRLRRGAPNAPAAVAHAGLRR